ncbi:monovalent cation/H(+) antiporter subunit G [Gemmobacter sp. 24YEA27]|uniref:monovalent cation/H(+) antiporter subunit G n=1 Tax=Gemmobacter sp. 24YEA27 TaxID=3040672 RepID=UPI0024B34CD3|nr:monovalent cation/H(+) antiporter subunit G [Gemmobacter sp. 24YEA27]
MTEVITGVLALAAGVFAVIAALGVLRFPDVLTRMHAASKVGAFAGSLALLAAAIGFGTTGAVVKALVAILFLFVTAPIAAHLIGRASAWRSGGLPRGRR